MNQIVATVTPELDIRYDKAEMKNALLRLGINEKNYEGKQLLLSPSRYSGKKSKEQLGYAFAGIVDFAAKHLHGGGYTRNEMYAILMDRCNKRPVLNRKTGELERLSVGLSHCGKYETAQVIDEAIGWLASEGCTVESPEEYKARKAELEKLKSNEGDEE
jgi:hypothetical protein